MRRAGNVFHHLKALGLYQVPRGVAHEEDEKCVALLRSDSAPLEGFSKERPMKDRQDSEQTGMVWKGRCH